MAKNIVNDIEKYLNKLNLYYEYIERGDNSFFAIYTKPQSNYVQICVGKERIFVSFVEYTMPTGDKINKHESYETNVNIATIMPSITEYLGPICRS